MFPDICVIFPICGFWMYNVSNGDLFYGFYLEFFCVVGFLSVFDCLIFRNRLYRIVSIGYNSETWVFCRVTFSSFGGNRNMWIAVNYVWMLVCLVFVVVLSCGFLVLVCYVVVVDKKVVDAVIYCGVAFLCVQFNVVFDLYLGERSLMVLVLLKVGEFCNSFLFVREFDAVVVKVVGGYIFIGNRYFGIYEVGVDVMFLVDYDGVRFFDELQVIGDYFFDN